MAAGERANQDVTGTTRPVVVHPNEDTTLREENGIIPYANGIFSLASTCEALQTSPIAICVICLEPANESAEALPCRHAYFHFTCLSTWLSQNRACPLCKSQVISIGYQDSNTNSKAYFNLPAAPSSTNSARRGPHQSHVQSSPLRIYRSTSPDIADRTIRFRRRVYEHGLYSFYIGNNHISGYRNITPELIRSDTMLLQRAKKWVRRELRALDPWKQYFTSSCLPRSAGGENTFRNAEFLLEYIVAVIKHIDLKGSAGQAELILREHLGRDNASLFVHELENWLRSPFKTLEEWDAFVQYPEV